MEMVCYKQPPQSTFSRASCEPSAIEKITGTITDECNNRYYCVKWKETWEPEDALRHCSVLVNEFWESRGGVVAISCKAQESDKKYYPIARSSAQFGSVPVYRNSDELSISGNGKLPPRLGGFAKVRHARRRLSRSKISKSTAAALSALPRLAGSGYMTHCCEVKRIRKSMEQAHSKSSAEEKDCVQTDDGVCPRPCARRMIAKASQTDDSMCTQTSSARSSEISIETATLDADTGEKLINIAQQALSETMVVDRHVEGKGRSENDGTLGNVWAPICSASPIVGTAEVFADGPDAQDSSSNRCQLSKCGLLVCGRGLPTADASSVIDGGTRFDKSPSKKCEVEYSMESFSDSEPSGTVDTALALVPDGDISNPCEMSSESRVSSEQTCSSAFNPFVSRVKSQHLQWQNLRRSELLPQSQGLVMADATTSPAVMVESSSLPALVAGKGTTAAEKKIKRPVTGSVGCDDVLVKHKKPCNSLFPLVAIDGFDVAKPLSQESPQCGESSFRAQTESTVHPVVKANNVSQAWDETCAGALGELSARKFDLPQISCVSENLTESIRSARSSEHNWSLTGRDFAAGTGSESLCLPLVCSALGEQPRAEIRALHSLVDGKGEFRADVISVNAPASTSGIAVCLPNDTGAINVAASDRLIEADDPNSRCSFSSPVSLSDIVLIKGADSATFSSIDDATFSCESVPSANIKVVNSDRLLSVDNDDASCEILSAKDRRMGDSSVATSTDAEALTENKVSSVLAWKDLESVADRNSPCVGVADGLGDPAGHRCGMSSVGKATDSVMSESLKSTVSRARAESESNSITLKVKVEDTTPDAEYAVPVSSDNPKVLQALPVLQTLPGLRIPRSTLKRALSTSSVQRKVAAIAKTAVSGSHAVLNSDAPKAAPTRVVDSLHYPATVHCGDVCRNSENDLSISHALVSARDVPIISAPPVSVWLDVACTQGLAGTAGTFMVNVPSASSKLCAAIAYVPACLVAASPASFTSATLNSSTAANVATKFSSSVVGSSPCASSSKPHSVSLANGIAATSTLAACDANVPCAPPHTSGCLALASSVSVGVASSPETTERAPAAVRQVNTPEARRIFYLSRHAACFPPFSSGRCPRIATVSESSQVSLAGRKHDRGEKAADVPVQIASPLDASLSQSVYAIASPRTVTSVLGHGRVASRSSFSVTTSVTRPHPIAPKSQGSAGSISTLPPFRMRATENASFRHTSVDLAKLSTSILMSSIPDLQSSLSRKVDCALSSIWKREDQERM